jgi:prepilin-type N-terminal cleavage/methylation domain-containing protein
MTHRVNTNIHQRGFTIVELLIVIVVIGILAAITIVAFSGITARAKNTKVQTNATSAKKVAEAFNADNGKYPALTTEFVAGSTSTKLPSALTPLRGPAGTFTSGAFTATPQLTVGVDATSIITALSAANGETNFLFSLTGTAVKPTGGVIVSWDFSTNNYEAGANYEYYGDANASSTFLRPTS